MEVATAIGTLALRMKKHKLSPLQFVDQGKAALRRAYMAAAWAGMLEFRRRYPPSRLKAAKPLELPSLEDVFPDDPQQWDALEAGLEAEEQAEEDDETVQPNNDLVNEMLDVYGLEDWGTEAGGTTLPDHIADQRASDLEAWLLNLAGDILAGESARDLVNRLNMMTGTLTGAYEQGLFGFGRLLDSEARIVWYSMPDACPPCLDKNEEVYTFDTLPGWPGDGGFGDLCEGGPNCRCFLEYAEFPVSGQGNIVHESAADLLAAALGTGGFTYNPFSFEVPHSGYMVSPYKDREQTFDINDLTPQMLRDYIAQNSDLLRQSDQNMLGGWLDKETGKFYLDISTIAASEQAAAQIAKQNNQEAYYDLANGQEVRVDEGGEAAA